MPTQYFRNRMDGEILSEDDITYAQFKSGNWEEFKGLVRWEIATTTSAGGGSVRTCINQERGVWVLFFDISDLEMESRGLRCKAELLRNRVNELEIELGSARDDLRKAEYRANNLSLRLRAATEAADKHDANLKCLMLAITDEHADLESLRQLVTSGLITDTYNEQED